MCRRSGGLCLLKVKNNMLKLTNKLQYLQDNHFSEWLSTRQIVLNELSDKQSMFCLCGRLATGLHENGCRKFQTKVTTETVKRLEHLLPKCEWVPCDAQATHFEPSGDGRMVHVCTPHRRLLQKQKLANANV